ncbi:hypothetical protein QTH90_29125 [Variovorax sp. J2P1-59]|uniref:hypothetical protein n=1 Tax=Variovorax flavidus TaxID=3053501 RepID=UPI002576D900|nr:hypothetical protein [Variovorax sp. J2P1-59]MDM0078502.1 hypothetical protein [Variovorax sp. J2P1-59]
MRPGPHPDFGNDRKPQTGERVSSRPPLELPIKAASPLAKARSELLIVIVMAAILLTCSFAFRRTEDAGRLPRPLVRVAPLTIDDLHPRIQSVLTNAPGDGALEITLVEASPIYPASVVTDLARDALAVSHGLKAYFPDLNQQTIRFIAKAPEMITFGPAKAPTAMLSLEFNRSDLMAEIGKADFTFQTLLNRSTGSRYLHASAAGYVAAFCSDPIGRSAAVFCSREMH